MSQSTFFQRGAKIIDYLLIYYTNLNFFYVKSLVIVCLYFKSHTIIPFLPDPGGDFFGEAVHELAGDGVVHAHDETVVDTAGFGALGLGGSVTEALEIQETFLDGVVEGEGAAHLVSFGDGDPPAAVGFAGMEAQAFLHGQALGAEHALALGLQRFLDKPFLDTHYSRTISI